MPARAPPATPDLGTRLASYTPKHLAEKIRKSRSVLEGERRQLTVLFAEEVEHQRLGLIDIILCEVLRGVREERHFRAVEARLMRFEVHEIGGREIALAAQLPGPARTGPHDPHHDRWLDRNVLPSSAVTPCSITTRTSTTSRRFSAFR